MSDSTHSMPMHDESTLFTSDFGSEMLNYTGGIDLSDLCLVDDFYSHSGLSSPLFPAYPTSLNPMPTSPSPSPRLPTPNLPTPILPVPRQSRPLQFRKPSNAVIEDVLAQQRRSTAPRSCVQNAVKREQIYSALITKSQITP
ncbi:hypothetical protein C8R41DRAFT_915859 [Lentinula lateritia]|uniref:Uncharacterized protein n=1 Tax=Lentinula lateritia TaxID=40482 RepID=A0ABQ8VS66_9AGAR|nr:hypothetical protein C8R41DRAFT_915859 [Lentinula lateritia]